MVVTKLRRSAYVELQDTNTWGLVGPRDSSVEEGMEGMEPC